VSNEILEERHAVFSHNFPGTAAIAGDVWKMSDQIEAETTRRLRGGPLTLLYATPPCQGMSKNGRGKLLSEVRAGRKPGMDERNRLIIPTINLASDIPYHRVPLLDQMKYWWVSNTPPERTAFDNQCGKCGFQENGEHTARHDKHGINRASRQTPLFCQRCGEMLPRPSVEQDGKHQLMKGFTSAYKRMSADRPASALTRNLSYACSDNKLHPTQNRVLSLFEAFRIHTVDQFDYQWCRKDGKKVSDKTIREVIGESIPPAGLKVIVDHVLGIYRGQDMGRGFAESLFPTRDQAVISSPSLR
jgi:site-specific DNA-cytosine methylase